MSQLTEFQYFPQLPTELRLAIWEFAKPSPRLIVPFPCKQCGHGQSSQPKKSYGTMAKKCFLNNHPGWVIKVQAVPRGPIFSLLHTCHESRAVWLPKFAQMPRYVDLSPVAAEHALPEFIKAGVTHYKARIEVPFISYEMDIVTFVTDMKLDNLVPWTAEVKEREEHNRDREIYMPAWSYLAYDPYLGLDKHLIQNFGVWSNKSINLDRLAGMHAVHLPALKRASLICRAVKKSGKQGKLLPPALDNPNIDLHHVAPGAYRFNRLTNQKVEFELCVVRYGKDGRLPDPDAFAAIAEAVPEDSCLWSMDDSKLISLTDDI